MGQSLYSWQTAQTGSHIGRRCSHQRSCESKSRLCTCSQFAPSASTFLVSGGSVEPMHVKRITAEHPQRSGMYFQALMESICGLSYTGDIRMTWGEDRQKVQRIVQGSWPVLIRTFLPHLKVCNPLGPCEFRYVQELLWSMSEEDDIAQTVCGDAPLLFQGAIGKAAELGIRSASHTFCNLTADAVLEQNPGLPQTRLLLSFLPQVPSLRCQH